MNGFGEKKWMIGCTALVSTLVATAYEKYMTSVDDYFKNH